MNRLYVPTEGSGVIGLKPRHPRSGRREDQNVVVDTGNMKNVVALRKTAILVTEAEQVVQARDTDDTSDAKVRREKREAMRRSLVASHGGSLDEVMKRTRNGRGRSAGL